MNYFSNGYHKLMCQNHMNTQQKNEEYFKTPIFVKEKNMIIIYIILIKGPIGGSFGQISPKTCLAIMAPMLQQRLSQTQNTYKLVCKGALCQIFLRRGAPSGVFIKFQKIAEMCIFGVFDILSYILKQMCVHILFLIIVELIQTKKEYKCWGGIGFSQIHEK